MNDAQLWRKIRHCLCAPVYTKHIGLSLEEIDNDKPSFNAPILFPYRLYPVAAPDVVRNSWGCISSKHPVIIMGLSTYVPQKYRFNRYHSIHRNVSKCCQCNNNDGYYTAPIKSGVIMFTPDSEELVVPLYSNDFENPGGITWGNPALNIYFDEGVIAANRDMNPVDTVAAYFNPSNWIMHQIDLKKKELNKLGASLLCISCIRKSIKRDQEQPERELFEEFLSEIDVESFANDNEWLTEMNATLVAELNLDRQVPPPQNKEPSGIKTKQLIGVSTSRKARLLGYMELIVPKLPNYIFFWYFMFSLILTIWSLWMVLWYGKPKPLRLLPTCEVDDIHWLTDNAHLTILEYENQRDICNSLTLTKIIPTDPMDTLNLCDRTDYCNYSWSTFLMIPGVEQ